MRRISMDKLTNLWFRYGTPRNRKAAYVILALAALAIAGGAPGAGSGTGGGLPSSNSFFFLGF
jgi:hypothetical protein